MKSDAEFRREIQDLKLMHLFAARAVFDMYGRWWMESNQAIHKRVLQSDPEPATLN